MYLSTRNKKISVDSKTAIKEGLSKDGGLYVPEKIERLDDIYKYQNFSYSKLASHIISNVLDDIKFEDIDKCVKDAYFNNFDHEEVVPLVKAGNDYYLELWHGPTCAFKDIALTFLPRIMKIAANDKPIVIITATSGDTGKAALEGFKDVDGTYIKVLFPHKMVSSIQERQMTTTGGKNTEVLAVKGNFDDCQRMAKRILETYQNEDMYLTSANSINIARLIPQIVYYFKAYYDLLNNQEIKKDELVDFVVPTGNFGDILAGYMAKRMGLPINKLVCASNENDVLTKFFNTGKYDANRELYNTISPSIDILVSSNLERLLYFETGDSDYVKGLYESLNKEGSYTINNELLTKLNNDFLAISVNQDAAKKAIKEVYEQEHYLLDTHTAVAKAVADKYHSEYKKIILSTASPFKFSKAVFEAITGVVIEDNLEAMNVLSDYTGLKIPTSLATLKDLEIRHQEVIDKNDDELIIRKLDTI